MSCGWAELRLKDAKKSKIHIEVKGGSPFAALQINKKDLAEVTKSSGLGSIFGIGSDKKSELILTTKMLGTIDKDIKTHMEMLPSTCLIPKRLVHFVSGFRNFAARKLHKDNLGGQFRHPGGDVTISSFPSIMDNPDILPLFCEIWNKDVVEKWTSKQRFLIPLARDRADEYIKRIYPALFSEQMGLGGNVTNSAAGNQKKMEKRKELVEVALKYDPTGRGKNLKNIENITSFKPFNINEIKFEVWEAREAKAEQTLEKLNSINAL